MIKLLKFELRKLIGRKSTYVMLVVQFLSIAFQGFIALLIVRSADGEAVEFLGVSTTGFSMFADALNLGMTSVIFAVFVSLFVCGDRADDVLKNVYARGYTSTQVYFAELIVLIGYAAVFCVFSWVCGLLIGCILFGFGSGCGAKIVAMLLVQLLAVLAYLSIFFMFSKIIGKMGATIIVNVLVTMFASLLFTLIDIAANNLISGLDVQISSYWIDGIIKAMAKSTAETKDIGIDFAITIIYIAVANAIGWTVDRNRAA